MVSTGSISTVAIAPSGGCPTASIFADASTSGRSFSINSSPTMRSATSSCSVTVARSIGPRSGLPNNAACSCMSSRKAICAPTGSPSSKGASTDIRHCPKTLIGIANRRACCPNGSRRRACEDILYYLASTAEMWRFPHYRTHRPYYQAVEYAGWARRLLLRRRSERRAAAEIAALRGDPRYFFPLQLDCDSQMRVHSPFRATHLAIDHVLSSFAAHAPSTARLIVKLHPMDSGLVDWAGMVGHLAAEYLVAERVTVLDGGDLPKVLAGADAVVTVNSTVGAQAVARGLPVIALGKAVYDMPGLTYQGGLDDFWTDARPPDPSLFDE